MKWGFPNRSSFGYCLLQQPLLMAGVAAEAPGISCGQGSWQQFGAASTDFVPNLCPFHPHSTSCSSATHQRSPSTQMKIISFLIFPQPQCISSSSSCPPFTADQCQQCTGKGLCDSLQTGTSLTAEHLSYVAQSTVSTSSITQAAELSCPGKWGIKATNHFWKKKRKKKKRRLKCLYICKILVSVETFLCILDAQLCMACPLQGIILHWMCNPFNCWASLNFPFLSHYVSCIYQKWLEIQDFAFLSICMSFLYKAWKYFSSGIY